MSEFVEIKIEVKAADGDSYIISNDDGICSIIERDDDPYHLFNTIKRQLAKNNNIK